jgi:hypothetical protein
VERLIGLLDSTLLDPLRLAAVGGAFGIFAFVSSSAFIFGSAFIFSFLILGSAFTFRLALMIETGVGSSASGEGGLGFQHKAIPT